MAKFRSQVREYPGRWVGFHLKWLGDGSANRAFNEYLKTLPMRSFDMQSKTWWVPGDYATLVLATARDLGLLNDNEFKEGGRVCGAANVAPIIMATVQVGDMADVRAEAFSVLRLAFDAPWWLVHKAWSEWRIRLHDVGAAQLEIDRLDAAYNFLKGLYEKSTDDALKPRAESDEDIPF